uniref:RNA helicase n=1 Tax=Echeneis naucrates TaxID=173247 RepID=A0A665TAV7_ECHNA
MASDKDQMCEIVIEDFRPRLRELIVVDRVLDHVHFLEPDRKSLISQKARSDGNTAAADLLIDAVLKKPHSPGWFTAFVDALLNSDCSYAADYIQLNLPDPEVERENDQCVRLIELLSPSLVNMKTADVCEHCYAQLLFPQEDFEIINAETANKGPIGGARLLLKSIVRGQPGWFSKFLQILRDTEHKNLYELTGGSPDCDKQGDSFLLKHTPLSLHCMQFKIKLLSCIYRLVSDEKLTSPKDEVKGSKAVTEPAESCDPSEVVQINITEKPQDTAAARDAENADIVLRDYQMDVASPALEGKNIIVCLPTGSGKTRVAVYITKKHLERRRAEGQSGKVVVLVNKVPLVEQHYTTEFFPFLKQTYKVERVSGDCQLKISFTKIVKENDVIICTAQILENYLERFNKGEDDGVNLSDLTLIIIDECHHTQKGGVYNHIMMRYLKQKHKNIRLKKEGKEITPLPQILGLTASPGVGGASKLEKAVDHILQICANLDASKIMTGNLGAYKKEPRKKTLNVEDRKADPFGDVIKKIMNAIHTHAELNPNCELGSQNYEQWVVQKKVKAATDEDHKVRVCAEHLHLYNEGLNLCNTIRMRDAFNFLNNSHEEEIKKKTSPDGEQAVQITATERFLFNLFKELQMLAENPDYENDSLSKLQSKILHEFSTREEARGIIFTKTRRSAIALSQWIQENLKFADIGVKASYVIGGGDQSNVKPMTAAERNDVLNKFRNGEINLLVATTVAEEGLDIPSCNVVIRYGLVTNEISMIQAEGRGRAEDSSYTLVEVKNSGVAGKEYVNEYRKDMMHKAIDKIRTLDQAEYDQQILEFQMQAILEKKVRMTKKKHKDIKTENPSKVKFSCRGCSLYVCTGEDIQIIAGVHRVNVTPEFSELFNQTENTSLQEKHLDCETSGFIACKKCGEKWGSMMMYRSIECPCLHVKNFVVTINEKKIGKCTKWSELPVRFSPFDYAEHARRVAQSSDDDETA